MSPRAKQSTLIFPPGEEPRGKTERQRFDDVMDRLLSASKEDVDRRMREHENAQHRRPKPKRSK